MSNLYHVVYKGQLIEGFDLESVKQSFAKAFKLDSTKSEKFFTGKAIVIKKNIDQQKARQYKHKMAKLGALVELRKVEENAVQENAKISLAETQQRTRQEVIERIRNAKQAEKVEKVEYDFSEIEYQPPNPLLQFVGFAGLGFAVADFSLNWMGLVKLTGFDWTPLITVLVSGIILKFSSK